MDICPIADVEALVLRSGAGDADALDGSAETVLIRIRDAEGRTGVGEADSPAEAIRSLILMQDAHAISRGLRGMLIDRDPVEIGALWETMASGTVYNGEAGIARHAIAAIDIALHDLAGKQLGRPSFHLLGGARRPHLVPYSTIYVGATKGRTLSQMVDALLEMLQRAVAVGFRAVKAEVLFDDLATDRALVEVIREVRHAIGDEIELLVDFGYRWTDWRDALWTLNQVEDCRLWLAEATLQHNDLVGHARLADHVEVRIGGAEFASSLEECRAWLEVGKVDCLQPDVARAGGLTEMRRIADLAGQHGASVIPHCWKTGINAAGARHFHAGTKNVPMIEMLAPSLFTSPLRRDLVEPEPEVSAGTIALPTAPGLGIRVVDEAIERYRVEELLL